MGKFWFNSKLTEAKETEDGNLKIKGVAINATTSRNNVKYGSEELKNASATLMNKPLMLDHSEKTRDVVGTVTNSKFENDKVVYEAIVDGGEKDIVRKLKNGFLKSVSIGADYDEDNSTYNDGVFDVKGLEFLELSVVPVPGIKDASISQVIEKHHSGEKNMEEKKENHTAIESKLEKLENILETMVAEKEAEKAEEKAKKEEEDKEEEEKKKKETEKKISSLKEEFDSLKDELKSQSKSNNSGKGKVDSEESQETKLVEKDYKNGRIQFYQEDPDYLPERLPVPQKR